MATIQIPQQQIEVPDPPRPRYALVDGSPTGGGGGTPWWAIVLIVLTGLVLATAVTLGVIALARTASSTEVAAVGKEVKGLQPDLTAAKAKAEEAAKTIAELREAVMKKDGLGAVIMDTKARVRFALTDEAGQQFRVASRGDVAVATAALQAEHARTRAVAYTAARSRSAAEKERLEASERAFNALKERFEKAERERPDYNRAIDEATGAARGARAAAEQALAAAKETGRKVDGLSTTVVLYEQ